MGYSKIHLDLSTAQSWPDINRFADLGEIASMQPNHCTSDDPWVTKRLGNARSQEGAYVWQKLIQARAIITSGTDA